MDINQYQFEVENTKSSVFYNPDPSEGGTLIKSNQSTGLTYDILHAIIGISTEGGELLDVAKKALFYGRAVDFVNLDEEIGDVMWYVGIYCNARGTTIEQICATNNAKLRARFPNKFTEQDANNRDLEKERTILEKGGNLSAGT